MREHNTLGWGELGLREPGHEVSFRSTVDSIIINQKGRESQRERFLALRLYQAYCFDRASEAVCLCYDSSAPSFAIAPRGSSDP
jgi:hypothetical protein